MPGFGTGGAWVYEMEYGRGTGWLGLVATEERTECAVVERGQARGGVCLDSRVAGGCCGLIGEIENPACPVFFPWSSLPPGSPHCYLLSDGDGSRPKAAQRFKKSCW